MSPKPKHVRFDVVGVVQGVGFRPFVYALAARHRLAGTVVNTSAGVIIDVQGAHEDVEAFTERLPRELPPLAFIAQMSKQELAASDCVAAMQILPSRRFFARTALLPPDTCVCAECLRELRDPADRRFGYPFINCTHCGPRYTIISDVPYDRDKTTMAPFRMCPSCQSEYEDPSDRRFHAQPNACGSCGPAVWLADSRGQELARHDAMDEAAHRLAQGQVLAIKGLGGFHLAVDATNPEAVGRLRDRKHRDAKPLAVMCRDLAQADAVGVIDEASREMMLSRHRPIVLVQRQRQGPLAPGVAPGNGYVGLMLPYTPLHVVLLDRAPPVLVMTSGNLSDEPIATDNDEAIRRLGSIADAFLLHDRDILVRNDDSVVQVIDGRQRFVRRSRGYVPLPIMLGCEGAAVLAVGGELKNTVCLTRDRMAFMSQHIGDVANLSTFESFEQTVARLKQLLDVRPEVIACDLHPDYLTSRWAEAQGLPLVRVQHHHAHIASCLAEHAIEEPVLGLALDGTGLGVDDAVWGGELLLVGPAQFERLGHLSYVRLPGSDRATAQPWRMALSYLRHAYGAEHSAIAAEVLRGAALDQLESVSRLLQSGFNSPWTSSCGRLFDAIAALCGLGLEARFEAQLPMALEAAARGSDDTGLYSLEVRREAEGIMLDPALLVKQVVGDLRAGERVEHLAARFHRGLAEGFAQACELARQDTGITRVALSGGVLQNRLLAEHLIHALRQRQFTILMHVSAPANDGGLALGQAWVALHQANRAPV